MNDLITTDIRTAQRTIDSRIVADMVGKEHKNLLADIRTYIGHMDSAALKIQPSDFFLESSYMDSTGRTLPCYLVTKKGCEMIANKMTGAKGIQFTAAYVTKFNDMERGLATPDGETELIKAKASRDRATAMLMNARARAYKAIMGTIGDKTLSPIAMQLFGITAIEEITGSKIDYRPEAGRLWTASEIAAELGVPAQTLGKIAVRNALKTPQYGIWALDKSPYGPKQVQTFRYNEAGRARLIELARGERLN